MGQLRTDRMNVLGGSRPSNKWGAPVIQTLRDGGGGGEGVEFFFRPFGPQFGLKVRGPSLGSATDYGGLLGPKRDNCITVKHHVDKNVIANQQSKSAKTA